MRTFGFRVPVVERHVVTVPGLVGQWRVAHLTDLHFGWATPIGLQQHAVRLVNELRPDVVALTGDFVCRGAKFLGAMRRTLGALEAPAVAVLGNHDHDVCADAVARSLTRGGIAVLRNDWMVVAGLPIVGVDDPVTGQADPGAATRGLVGPALGLCHGPEASGTLWSHGVPVVLSGHTHAGQWDLSVVRSAHRALGHRYLGGMYREPGGTVYVNPGVGSSLIPWRYGQACRRTVADIQLIGTG